jgi:hypothetical protein
MPLFAIAPCVNGKEIPRSERAAMCIGPACPRYDKPALPDQPDEFQQARYGFRRSVYFAIGEMVTMVRQR